MSVATTLATQPAWEASVRHLADYITGHTALVGSKVSALDARQKSLEARVAALEEIAGQPKDGLCMKSTSDVTPEALPA